MSVLAAACGGGGDGGDDRVLELVSGPITEDELRVEFRSAFRNDPAAGFETLCDQFLLGDPSTDDVLAAFAELAGEANATPVSDADPEDEARAAEIVEEECVRRMNE